MKVTEVPVGKGLTVRVETEATGKAYKKLHQQAAAKALGKGITGVVVLREWRQIRHDGEHQLTLWGVR